MSTISETSKDALNNAFLQHQKQQSPGQQRPKATAVKHRTSVLDTTVLLYALPYVKQKIREKHCQLCVPQQVLRDLDELKQTLVAARDAIRFLDIQTCRSDASAQSRRLHIQASEESAPLPNDDATNDEATSSLPPARVASILSCAAYLKANKAKVQLLVAEPPVESGPDPGLPPLVSIAPFAQQYGFKVEQISQDQVKAAKEAFLAWRHEQHNFSNSKQHTGQLA